jgi:hypothetical protein
MQGMPQAVSPTLVAGMAGLAVGLVAGYVAQRGTAEPRPGPQVEAESRNASPAGLNASIIQSRPVVASTKPPPTDSETQRVLQAIPTGTEWSARQEWLRTLPTGDLPLLTLGLCLDSGPGGLGHDKMNLLRNTLDQWWRVDREGLLGWLRALPPGGTKRFLTNEVLSRHLLEVDPRRAAAFAQAYAAEDPGWDGSKFNDATIALRIEEAWKNPQITAAEMVNLYAQLSRGNSVQSQMIGVYPPNFDFRAFLDGLRALKMKDSQSPSAMPGDTLRQWAAIDPQGAAEWLLEAQTSPQGGWTSRIPFADWEHIADAVSAKNGPQAYYQWAAQILAQSPEEWGKIIITESKDGELAGIVACITDTALRDRLLVENAGARHWSAGSMTDRLAMISTPELRLRAIANNPHQFRSWAKTAGRDAGMWERLGLTYEQVAEVLPEERSRR